MFNAALIAGRQKLALVHGELPARYDLDRVETRADGEVLTGEKCVFVAAEATDVLIVSARHSGVPDAQSGLGLWTLQRDSQGARLQGYNIAQGGWAAELSLTDTPATPLMHEGYQAIARAMSAATLAEMAQGLGAMDVAVAMTQEYLTRASSLAV